jgi:transcriptional regulator with XRE-family HTH domain
VGRPRKSRNSAPLKLTVARIERLRRGLSLQSVSTVTGIPLGSLSEMERGTMKPDEEDLKALGRLYDYTDPAGLLREAVVVPAEPKDVVTHTTQQAGCDVG